MLTARDDVADKVDALGLGCRRLRFPSPFPSTSWWRGSERVLRRHTGSQELLTYGDLELNQATHEVHRNGKVMELTTREYDLLRECLMRHPRQVLTRDRLLEQVWGYNADLETNVLRGPYGAPAPEAGSTWWVSRVIRHNSRCWLRAERLTSMPLQTHGKSRLLRFFSLIRTRLTLWTVLILFVGMLTFVIIMFIVANTLLPSSRMKCACNRRSCPCL